VPLPSLTEIVAEQQERRFIEKTNGKNEMRAGRLLGLGAVLSSALVNTESDRSDHYRASKLARFEGLARKANILTGAFDMTDAFDKAMDDAEEGRKRLNEQLKAFRSSIANDLSSIKASGEKVREESGKISQAFSSVMAQLNSTEMVTAIQNAERLAAALSSIEKLKSARITFAVIDTPVAQETVGA